VPSGTPPPRRCSRRRALAAAALLACGVPLAGATPRAVCPAPPPASAAASATTLRCLHGFSALDGTRPLPPGVPAAASADTRASAAAGSVCFALRVTCDAAGSFAPGHHGDGSSVAAVALFATALATAACPAALAGRTVVLHTSAAALDAGGAIAAEIAAFNAAVAPQPPLSLCAAAAVVSMGRVQAGQAPLAACNAPDDCNTAAIADDADASAAGRAHTALPLVAALALGAAAAAAW
jgi:hypothetical protein